MRQLVRQVRGWVRGLWKNVLINRIGAWPGTPRALRMALLRFYGVSLGPRVIISSGCWIGGKHISFGAGAAVNRNCLFENSAPITIGKRCGIGPHTRLLTSAHEIGPSHHRTGRLVPQPIEVGDGTWIGASVTVLPGVTIGEGCVIAAGAVVTKDCLPNGLYGGVPARRLRDLGVDDGAMTPVSGDRPPCPEECVCSL